jgi:high affinity Mn2+ porin
MLKMKWMTDHDGRLVATWIQSGEAGFPGGRAATIMLELKWTTEQEGCLVQTRAELSEPASMVSCLAASSKFKDVRNYAGFAALQSPNGNAGFQARFLAVFGHLAIVLAYLIPSMLSMVVAGASVASAQDASNLAPPDPQSWDIHMQSTVVGQGHPSFPADYTGANSLTPDAMVRETISVDVTGGVRLWRGGEFLGDLLMWQGYGLNNSLGVAGFPNAEAYRVGKTYPDLFLCRAYLRETIGSGGEKEATDDGLGSRRAIRNLTLTVGHLSAKDTFDTNAYANDGRSQFMNWVLVANGAWDYPADTLGFTNGAGAELNTRAWSGRLGIFQVSKVANGIRMDWNLAHAWSDVAEIEKRYSPKGHAGAIRLLAYDTRAHMGSYQETVNDPSLGENIFLTAAYRYKYEFGINLEQEIRKNLGVFVRLGWNDGKNQTYEFTDVDRTATAGLSLKGARWRRSHDTVGLAVVANGISAVHRQYLAAGGLGITVGDGALDYSAERIVEAY